MINYIQHISKKAAQNGDHFDCGPNSMLIQIMDPPFAEFPKPKYAFKEIHQFRFLDEENDKDEILGPLCINDDQAAELVRLLKHAQDEGMNVVVHCHAGICRSGAVAEVAGIMGFIVFDGYRIPNVLVKKKMMKVLGLTYDAPEYDQGDINKYYPTVEQS